MIRFCFILSFLSLFFISCIKTSNVQINKAFYYWKGNYSLSDSEETVLKDLQIKKLYIKFFEVTTDEIFGAIPVAKTRFHLFNSADSLEVVPTIYIKNEVFYSSSVNLDTLADNVLFLINKYYHNQVARRQSNYEELQMDCDWTAKTKDKYFYFLKALKKISQKKISCTLRLYPYKYTDAMGVPPVDKVTLMCYNLIDPLKNENKNSIQDNKELESYLKNAADYPLHMDFALPVFSWAQVYQNNKFTGIVYAPTNELKSALKQIKPFWYELQKDVELDELYLREGDKIKLEEITEKNTQETIRLLKKYIAFNDTVTVTLFHLDKENLKKYTHEELRHFYTSFNK
jgi:hypothetical protein